MPWRHTGEWRSSSAILVIDSRWRVSGQFRGSTPGTNSLGGRVGHRTSPLPGMESLPSSSSLYRLSQHGWHCILLDHFAFHSTFPSNRYLGNILMRRGHHKWIKSYYWTSVRLNLFILINSRKCQRVNKSQRESILLCQWGVFKHLYSD
jgi:hypothetical protein